MKTPHKKILKHLPILIASLLFLCFLSFGCNGGSSESSADDQSVPVGDDTPIPAFVEKTITPEGETVEFSNGVTMEVPPGAVSGELTLKIRLIDSSEAEQSLLNEPIPMKYMGGIVVETEAVVFNEPIKVSIPVTAFGADELPILVSFDPENGSIPESTNIVYDPVSSSANISIDRFGDTAKEPDLRFLGPLAKVLRKENELMSEQKRLVVIAWANEMSKRECSDEATKCRCGRIKVVCDFDEFAGESNSCTAVAETGSITFLDCEEQPVEKWSMEDRSVGCDKDSIPPSIVSHFPADNAAVDVDTKIEFTFTESMMANFAQKAFSIIPEVEGTFGWNIDDTKMTFNPREDLEYGESYTVGISQEALDKAGGNNLELTNLNGFSFTTTMPGIVVKQDQTELISGSGNYVFEDVTENASGESVIFTIENTGTADLHLSSGIIIDGTNSAEFMVDQTELTSIVQVNSSTTFAITFAPTSDGEKSATVAITNNSIDEGVFTFEILGTAIAQAVEVVSLNPISGAENVPLNTTILVAFSEPMDRKSAEEAFRLFPETHGTKEWQSDTRMSFIPNDNLEADVLYTVNIAETAVNLENKALDAGYAFSFRTTDDDVPAAGGAGVLTFTCDDGVNLYLNWTKASDDKTDQALLEYKIVTSTSDNLTTPSRAESNGTVVQNWTTDITTASVNDSTFETNNYYTVLVRDETGNTVIYNQKVAPIIEIAGPIEEGTYTYTGTDGNTNIGYIFGPGNNYTDRNGNSGTFTYSYESGLLSFEKWAVGSYLHEGESFYHTLEILNCFTAASGYRLHTSNYRKTEGDFSTLEGTYVHQRHSISDYLNPEIADRDDYLDVSLNLDSNGTSRFELIQTGSSVFLVTKTGTWIDNGDNTYTNIVTDPPKYAGETLTNHIGWVLFNGFWHMVYDDYYTKQ